LARFSGVFPSMTSSLGAGIGHQYMVTAAEDQGSAVAAVRVAAL